MPLYLFYCANCEKEETIMCSYNDRDANAPKCEEKNDKCEMKNVIHTTGLKMEGKGWFAGGAHVSSGIRKPSGKT